MSGYLVQTAFRGHEDWLTRSGHGSKESAQREARQVGPRWRRQGLRVRVVADDE